MNDNYKELYGQFDGIADRALKSAIDFVNKEVLAGAKRPANTMYFGFEMYKRSRLFEDKMREVSARVFFEPLPRIMRYDYWQFIALLDPAVKDICDRVYGHESPYAKPVDKSWRDSNSW